MVIFSSNRPLSTEGNKLALQLCQTIILKNQVFDRIVDLDALHYLSELQGIDPLPEGSPPMIVEPIQDSNAANDQINYMKNLKGMEINNFMFDLVVCYFNGGRALLNSRRAEIWYDARRKLCRKM